MTKTIACLCLAVVVAGCGLTQRQSPKQSRPSGLLDYSLLTPGKSGEAALRYVDPAARWTEYKKIMIDPVTFWAGARSVPARDQQALCDYLYAALVKQFGQRFEVVQQPGPGVMRLHVALVDASSATPILRSFSMIVPQARVLATLKYLATGTYPFVGGAQVEAKLVDSLTGEILGELVDRRVGGGSVQAAAQWQWGDAQNAIDQWAGTYAGRVASWTTGKATP